MSDKSPLFVSTLELLAHATELYADASPQKYKFVILHLANAIELILKDCLIDKGVSIYNKDPYYNHTIRISDAFKEIKRLGVSIPEQPALELLINERNNIQHRFGFPTALTVFYYIEYVISFLKRFFEEQYNTKLSEKLRPYLSEENIALLGLIEGDYSHYKKHFEVSPEAAILQAFSEIETEISDFLNPLHKEYSVLNLPVPLVFAGHLKELIKKKYLSDDIDYNFKILQDVRNQIPTALESETKNIDWQSAMDTAIQILNGLSKAREDKIIDFKSDTDSEEADKSN